MADDAMAIDAPPPVLTLTPLNPAFREDPYRILNAIRERYPVMRDEMAGVFFISRHEDVRGIVTDLTMLRHPANAEEAAVLTRRGLDERAGPDGEPPRSSILTPPASAIPWPRPSIAGWPSSSRRWSGSWTRPSTGSVMRRPST